MFGIAITTHNRSEWCAELLNSLSMLDVPIVVVNDGKPYTWFSPNINLNLIENKKNLGIPKSKNRGMLELLKNPEIDYVFTIEDDMVIKDISVFEKFIKASQETKIPFWTFPAHAYHVGEPHKRTPVTSIQYKTQVVDFFPNMVASFCMFTRELLLRGGLYDESYGNSWFDVDLIVRYNKLKMIAPFWFFPCIQNIDDYVEMVPESVEKSEAHANNWDIQKNGELFIKKNGNLGSIPRSIPEVLKRKLMELYNG